MRELKNLRQKKTETGTGNGKFIQGCMTAIFVVFLIIFLIPLLIIVIHTVRLFGIDMRSLIPIFVLLVFASSFVQIIRARFKRRKEEVGEESQPTYKSTRRPDREVGKSKELENASEDTFELYKAFSLLNATPNMTYTQVSQRYYELVKKITQLNMDEEERSRKLKELEEAFEKVSKYYSERM